MREGNWSIVKLTMVICGESAVYQHVFKVVVSRI